MLVEWQEEINTPQKGTYLYFQKKEKMMIGWG
jgi:hypothetical protein